MGWERLTVGTVKSMLRGSESSDLARRSATDLRAAQIEDAWDRDLTADQSLRETDELFAMWGAARAEANTAFDVWCDLRGPRAYVAYRAAEDRADAAETALAVAVALRQAVHPARTA